MLTYAHPASRHEHVGVRRRGQVLPQARFGVAGNPEFDGDAAGPADQAEEGVGVRGGDLAAGEDLLRLVEIHDLFP